jgi:hypothetical protein
MCQCGLSGATNRLQFVARVQGGSQVDSARRWRRFAIVLARKGRGILPRVSVQRFVVLRMALRGSNDTGYQNTLALVRRPLAVDRAQVQRVVLLRILCPGRQGQTVSRGIA